METEKIEETVEKPVQAPAVIEREIRQISLNSKGEVVLNTIDDAVALAKKLFHAGLQPAHLDTAPKLFLGIMFAKQLGLNPIVGLRQIYVVNGIPMIYGDQPLALVKRSGLLEAMKEEEMLDKEGKMIGYKCYTKRKGNQEVTTTFTVEDAKLAGLWGKTSQGGKPSPWVTYPKRMLKMRSRGENLKDNFPDILGGIGILEYDLGTDETGVRDVESTTKLASASQISDKLDGENNDKIDA